MLFITATRLARSGLFDTKNRCSAASASSAWGISIFLLLAAIRASKHYPHLGLFQLNLVGDKVA